MTAIPGRDTMMGINQKKMPLVSDYPTTFANYLNSFYARFDPNDQSDECDKLCQSLDSFRHTS